MQASIMVPVRVPAGNSTLKPETEGSLRQGSSTKVQTGTGETNKIWCSVLGYQQQRAFTILKPERDKGRSSCQHPERVAVWKAMAFPTLASEIWLLWKAANWQQLAGWGARISQVSFSFSTSSLLHQASTDQTQTEIRRQAGLLMQL